MSINLTEKFPIAMSFDVNRALEVGWKGYTQNLGMGALLLFLGGLLIFVATITVAGLLFAVPHIAAGISMVGYYMVRGPVQAESLFAGFKKYGTILGVTLVLWIGYIAITLIFSGPYYYFLFQAMGDLGASGDWSARFSQAALSSEAQAWTAVQYAAYPVQFYINGRLLLMYPLIVEHGAGFTDAFAHSWRITSTVQWQLFLFMFLVTIIALVASFAGIIALIIGIFFALPLPMALLGAGMQQLLGETPPPAAS
jgi:hypothetical protein